MQLSIRHTTRYHFDAPATHGLQRLRLRPRNSAGQQVREWHITVEGGRIEAEYEDHHLNATTLVSFGGGSKCGGGHELAVHCHGVVETGDSAGVVGRHAGFMPLWALAKQTDLTRPGPLMRRLVTQFAGSPVQDVGTFHALSAAILSAVRYDTGHTDATTSAEAALAAGHGVCQDHAHILIGSARALGVPARYVSGYLLIDGLVDQEAGHAWAEVHVEGLGWVGFDVSNAICPDARYVRVAVGADYREAAPITGLSLGGAARGLEVELSVAQQQAEQ